MTQINNHTLMSSLRSLLRPALINGYLSFPAAFHDADPINVHAQISHGLFSVLKQDAVVGI
jgi:hypothetical protein